MRKVLFGIVLFVAFVVASGSVFAQGDASLWVKMRDGYAPEFTPWVTYDSGKMFLEARFNFDWENASTVFLGKSFSVGYDFPSGCPLWSAIPELGFIYVDEYKAVTSQLLAFSDVGKFGWFTMN